MAVVVSAQPRTTAARSPRSLSNALDPGSVAPFQQRGDLRTRPLIVAVIDERLAHVLVEGPYGDDGSGIAHRQGMQQRTVQP